MITMDPLAITISGLFLVGALIGVLKFISDRPSRIEMYETLDRNIQPILSELKYIRHKLDEVMK